MEQLIAEQSSDFHALTRILINLKKKGEANITEGLIETRLERLKELWGDFRSRHLKILAYKDEDSPSIPYFSEDVYATAETSYMDQCGFLTDMKTRMKRTQAPTLAGADAATAVHFSQLPRVDLPKFSGDVSKWRNFRDLFDSMVKRRPDIPKVQKLQHLKSCLSGEPAQLLNNTEVTEDNFDIAWGILEDRYDNRRVLVNAQLSTLLDLKPAHSESASELRRVLNATVEAVDALQLLECPVEHWSIFLAFLTVRRLDAQSRRDWSTQVGNASNPSSFVDLKKFLQARIRALEDLEGENKHSSSTSSSKNFGRATSTSNKKSFSNAHSSNPKSFHSTAQSAVSSNKTCSLCRGVHYITNCASFKDKSLVERRDVVQRLKLCFNCLGRHSVNECRSERRCNSCNGRHNSMLHQSSNSPSANSNSGVSAVPHGQTSGLTTPTSANAPEQAKAHMANLARRSSVLLATAKVDILGSDGSRFPARCLLDQGSEASFITESLAQSLRLPRRKTSVSLTGIGSSSAGSVKFQTKFTLFSRLNSSFELGVDALILSKLTDRIPSRDFSGMNFDHLQGFALADPECHLSAGIDVILGADVYALILIDGVERIPSSHIIAQNTFLGWVLSGPISSRSSRRAELPSEQTATSLHCSADYNLLDFMKRFWEIEEIPSQTPILKPEEEACENHFLNTYSRLPDGRYQVKLPWKDGPPKQGSRMRETAVKTLLSVGRRLQRDSSLAAHYADFMLQYEELGHMRRLSEREAALSPSWYLPHHGIVQGYGARTKLRVVFDASRSNFDGKSLNDFLSVGPALQTDLTITLLNWRRHEYVFVADIVKMFRQIHVHPEDQPMQRIVWKSSPQDEISDFQLTTVTYGTACAPFLALRVLRQLGIDEESRFPLGSQCILTEMYVDDVLSGADNLSVALEIRNQIIRILASGGFSLGKWASNHAMLLQGLSNSTPSGGDGPPIDLHDPVSTLGLVWNPSTDSFSYKVDLSSQPSGNFTKRSILSCVSRVFDPLGWISPVTIVGKILMQDAWISGVDWDTQLTGNLRDRWSIFLRDLPSLVSIRVDRWIGWPSNAAQFQLHGFADASSRAYAAVLYLKIIYANGDSRVTLLLAKTKVSPVKTITIPRLELSAAALLTRLILHVLRSKSFLDIPIFTWLDSQVALTWIRQHPSRWKTFVANRTSFIQSSLPSTVWRHVPSAQNPADLATRGVNPENLRTSQLWWQGPSWLSLTEESWPAAANLASDSHGEERSTVMVATSSARTLEDELISKFSSWTKLHRVVAFCHRFLSLCRNRALEMPIFLTAKELFQARRGLIHAVQEIHFREELAALHHGKSISRKSPLRGLSPFLDDSSILRVGGRLSSSLLPFNEKHPLILPKDSPLSRLYVSKAHSDALHGGPSLTFALLQKQVWVLGAKQLVKAHVRNCVTCSRHRPRSGIQQMGNLPPDRIRPSRPFSISGLDYAGPFWIRTSPGRGTKAYKGYLALFVCFATKAIHLEVVSDCSTNSFLAAYRRFAGRRGVCHTLWSDNSTTFHGADAELRSLFKSSSSYYRDVAAILANDGTDWKFIPPSSPHFGGLWEAGVKSVKHHFRRIVGETRLTFEEFSTVAIQIEACLNSRPLCPLVSDSEDSAALTPSHFLIGSALSTIPEPPTLGSGHLTRWKLVQDLHQRFWARWSSEYLHHLQQKSKWRSPNENFAVNQLVLVKDERFPPSKWPLGKIVRVYPGNDGLVRVADVKTATTVLRRPIVKLCPLPISDEPSAPPV